MAESFENLEIWKLSMDLAEKVYEASKDFPQEEQFGLTSQLRRAVVSVSSNIAEGSNRKTEKDFVRFLTMARGSLNEVESQIRLAKRLGYITNSNSNELTDLIDTIGSKIGALKNHLQTE